jgi:class 3 adenylate cyclase/tetratricopeptide (TPR) repeat protein
VNQATVLTAPVAPTQPPEASSPERLIPYVPRLLIDWLRECPDLCSREVDGSLAFIDISGFTSMTERLAKKGKVGAEEMNDLLNALFSELLAVAYDDGAGLVKWAGDAGYLLFDGPDHAARACRASLNMQKTIRRIGRITTSVGQVRLRMSIGIHSGPFNFFLVGDPAIHRELVIVGPSSTETVLMEQTAEAGEVAVSQGTVAYLEPENLLGPKEEAMLIKGVPDVPFLSARPGPNVEGIDVTSLIPVAIREHLLTGDESALHRRITAGFLEFQGTDELLEREGPKAVAEAVDECVRVVQRAAHAHEVGFFETDVARNAFRVMLIAGAPRSLGADEDRMLATLRFVMDANLPLALRIGTNAGHIFAGHFGPKFRKTFSVKGDAVNLAARLMGKAEPGQILATDSVLGAAGALYQTTAIPPFAAKGKKKPVEASLVGRRIGSQGEAIELPLVGRERELALLRAAVAAARGGRGQAVEIVGPPGIGKSRLLKEIAALVGEFSFFRAFCEPYQQQVAYRPFTAILRAVLDIPRQASAAEGGVRLRQVVEQTAPSLLPWLPLLAVVANVEVPMTQEVSDLGDDFRRKKLEDVVVGLLAALLTEPTAIELEDVHWMDEASAALLERLVEQAADQPWIFVTTRRDETTGFVLSVAAHSTPLVLEPLAADQTEQVITAVTADNPLRRHDIAALADRSAGNPLFLSQLLKIALQSGSVGDDLPLTVESLVTTEIDQLAPFDRQVLRFASVLGVAFEKALAESLLEVEEKTVDPAVWTRLENFLQPDGPGRARFRHALMREAAYEGLPYRRRTGLHARAGVMIIADSDDPTEHAELLSMHFFQAHTYYDAWQYSKVAGERALSKFANVEAAAFFERALDAGRRAGVARTKMAQVYEQVGDVRMVLNEFQAARAAYSEGRRLAVDPVDQSRFLLAEAKVHYRAGRLSDAVRSTRRAMRLLDGDARPKARKLTARLGAFYAGMRVMQGRYREAEVWCRRVLDMTREVREREALARAYYMLDFVYMDQGRVEDAVYSKRAADLYGRLGDLSNQAEVISNSAADAFELGEWERALNLLEESLELRRRLGDDGEAAIGAANVAEIYLEQGRLAEAEELLAAAVRTTRAGDYKPPHAYILGLLGRTAAAAGRFDDALAQFAEAREIFDEIGAKAYVFLIEVRTAELYVRMRDPVRALEQAEEAFGTASELEGTEIPAQLPLLHRICAYAHIQLLDLDEARSDLEKSLATARARQKPHEIALAVAALGQLDRIERRTPDTAAEADAGAILERLGVISMPALPLACSPQPAYA